MHKPFAVILSFLLCVGTLCLSACDKKPPLPPAPLVSAAEA